MLFFDKYISLSKIEKKLALIEASLEEKHELWELVDEIIHHRVLHCILDELPKEHHKEFLLKLHDEPHDGGIISFLKDKIVKDVEAFVRLEIKSIENEILKDLWGEKPKKKRKKK